MRGRLIFPFEVEIARLDTVATAADPDGAGPLVRGFDDDFKEPIVVGPGVGVVRRVEKALVRVPAQIEPGEFQKLTMFLNGDSPNSRFVTVSHFKWLEDNGFIGTDGAPLFNKGDRLTGIYDRSGGQVLALDEAMYVTSLLPGGYGLGRSRNLLFFNFDCRDTGLE